MTAKKLEIERFVERMRIHFAREIVEPGTPPMTGEELDRAMDCFTNAFHLTCIEWLRRKWND